MWSQYAGRLSFSRTPLCPALPRSTRCLPFARTSHSDLSACSPSLSLSLSLSLSFFLSSPSLSPSLFVARFSLRGSPRLSVSSVLPETGQAIHPRMHEMTMTMTPTARRCNVHTNVNDPLCSFIRLIGRAQCVLVEKKTSSLEIPRGSFEQYCVYWSRFLDRTVGER